jgi:uncharacterized membrane protein YhaH (DUF805 family)
MGGLGELFGFDGRINRLGYVGRSLVVGVGLAALAALGATTLATLQPGGLDAFQVWTQRLTMAVILLGLWAGFALTTRRLRDMGLEPAYVVPIYAALWVINVELLQPMARIQPESYAPIETAWLVAQVLAGVVLLFWPTRTPSAAEQRVYVAAQPAAYLDWRESK